MADFNAINENDLRKVFKKPFEIIQEIDDLIKSTQTKALDTAARTTPESDNISHDIIFIPMTERGRSLGTVELSVRLRNILEAKSIHSHPIGI